MRFPRRPQVPGHPFYTPVRQGVRGKVAPERPRRKPQVFPKSHVPRRRFAYFADAGKVGRRPQTAKYPLISREFRRCCGEFLSERSERNQRIAGGMARRKVFGLWPQAFARHSPGPPVLRECRRGAPTSGRALCPLVGTAHQIIRCNAIEIGQFCQR